MDDEIEQVSQPLQGSKITWLIRQLGWAPKPREPIYIHTSAATCPASRETVIVTLMERSAFSALQAPLSWWR